MTWAAFERSAYQSARSWGMQPSEFWTLPVADWWAELDGKIAEARQMEDRLEEIRSGNVKGKSNVFSRSEWEAARRKHSEKMKAMR